VRTRVRRPPARRHNLGIDRCGRPTVRPCRIGQSRKARRYMAPQWAPRNPIRYGSLRPCVVYASSGWSEIGTPPPPGIRAINHAGGNHDPRMERQERSSRCSALRLPLARATGKVRRSPDPAMANLEVAGERCSGASRACRPPRRSRPSLAGTRRFRVVAQSTGKKSNGAWSSAPGPAAGRRGTATGPRPAPRPPRPGLLNPATPPLRTRTPSGRPRPRPEPNERHLRTIGSCESAVRSAGGGGFGGSRGLGAD